MGKGKDGISFLPPLPMPQWTWRARNQPPPPLSVVVRCMGAASPCPWRSPPLSYSSSSVVLSEALPENHELHRHHAVVLPELSLNFSSPLAGSRRRRRPRAVRVLNAEAPSVRRLDRIFRDLNRREYDSINRVLCNASA